MNIARRLIQQAELLIARGIETRVKDRRVHQIVAEAHAEAVRRRKRPPEAGLAMPAVPPRGPLPLQGGAEAPLEFD